MSSSSALSHDPSTRDALVIDSVPGLVAILAPSGEVEAVNTQIIEYCGLPLEAMKHWGTNGIVHAEDVPRIVPVFSHAIMSGAPYDFEARLRRFDGIYRWFQVRGRPLSDVDGRIARWYVLLTDIDELKRAQEDLRRDEAFLARVQQLSATGGFYWWPATGEVFWSEQVYRIFEIDPAAPLTTELRQSRIHPDDLSVHRDTVQRAIGDARDFEYEVRLLMPDKSVKYVHSLAQATRDTAGSLLYVGAVQDITQRRLSDFALSKVRSELAHIARVTTLSALTASIAHEVNQPLSGVVTNASTCLRMLGGDPPNIEGARETARRTIRDGNRAAEVISRLRALYSGRETKSELVDLNEAAREVIALSLSELQRHGVVVRSEFAEHLAPAMGDRVQLQQVVLNLVRNASEAMSTVDDRPRELLVKTEQDERHAVRLSVRDAGVGFEPEAADKLFGAFYTTKPDGMGMGLSVSRSIIERHRGRLWAACNAGPGATFAFSIPVDTKV